MVFLREPLDLQASVRLMLKIEKKYFDKQGPAKVCLVEVQHGRSMHAYYAITKCELVHFSIYYISSFNTVIVRRNHLGEDHQ
jgi:hypothetical protein